MIQVHGAVIGSGVAGVAMAQALRRVGIGVDLFERDPEPRSTGYQLNVLANGMYALSRTGLLDGLRSSGFGAPLRSAPIVDGATGRIVRNLPVSGVGTGLAPRSFYRGDLHSALLAALEGAPPECGRSVAAVIDDPDREKVRIRFEDGDARDFDFVVGADGAYSRVRQSLFPDHPGYQAPYRALLFGADIDLDGDTEAERCFAGQLERGEFLQISAPARSMVIAAAGGSRFGVIIAGGDLQLAPEVSTPADAKELARAVVRGFVDPRVHHAIDRAVWEAGNPLVWEVGDMDPLPSYHVGRVALAGDAAHAMIPVVGQGANQSFEDAMILSGLLSGVAEGQSDRPAGIKAALRRYSAERAPHVGHIQAEARRRASALSSDSRLGYRVSMLVLRLLPRRVFDRFEEHVLKYAIADPDCPIEAP